MLNSSFRRYGSASKVVRDALRLLELIVTRRKGESVVLLAMNVTLTPTALNDLRYRLQNDKRQTERVFAVCEEIRRTPFDGIGKAGTTFVSNLPVAGHAGSTVNIVLSTKSKR